MANIFVNLPVPPGNGVGAAVNVSALGKRKTIVVENVVAAPFDQTITIEVSENAGFDFAPVASFGEPGKKQVLVAAQFMRARVSGFVSGQGQADVGANDNGAQFVSLPVPVGNGIGAPVATGALGSFKSALVGNPLGQNRFSGTINVEVSEDGVEFKECFSFTIVDIQSRPAFAEFMRVVRSGVDPDFPAPPVVDVGAINELISGAGGAFTRQNIYDNSVPASIILSPLNGPILFRDNAIPIGTLFEVQDSGGAPLVSLDPAELDVAVPAIDLNGSVEVEISAPLIDIDSAVFIDVDGAAIDIDATGVLGLGGDTVDIDGATDVLIDGPTIDITGPVLVDINSTTEVEIDAPIVDIGNMDSLTLAAGFHQMRMQDANNTIQLWPDNPTFTSVQTSIMQMSSLVTLDYAGPRFGALNLQGTIQHNQAGFVFNHYLLFNNGNTYVNDSGVAINFGPGQAFIDQPTIRADGAAISQGINRSFLSQPRFEGVGGGTLAVTTWSQIQCFGQILAGATVTTRRCVHVGDLAAFTGTLTTEIGIEIDNLSSGVTINGIRSALSGAAKRFINHTGTSPSDFGGDINLTGAALINFGTSNPLGGGLIATLGTVGGTGPGGSAQVAWIRAQISGVLCWIPYWQ